MAELSRILFLSLLSLLATSAFGHVHKHQKQQIQPQQQQLQEQVVKYDARSLIINGSRELLFSGSIHYPRSTPEMWPELIRQAKQGGLNVIQTYVFWNLHEPVQGQFNFEGRNDFIKFIKLIGEQGMWVTLRLGPYVEAEWNMGGFPYWLREIPGITFRTHNEPFMFHMKRFTEMILNMVKKENLFAEQGGPIILAQIENEYSTVQAAYRDAGSKYATWAAEMATSLYNGVPWIMCKQYDAPEFIISTCNGRQCGDTFAGPNGANKPSLWTENWTAQYRVFGDSPSMRAAEDIAFSVARFFARNGTLNNYYMYYGGTNFGRTSSSFVTTRYYDEAPLDEFGLRREPKYGHLRDLHRALRLSKKPLLWGTPKVQQINEDLEITTYEAADSCAAFLTNNNTREAATINFRGIEYYLPPKSISVLPDCKTVVYNSQAVKRISNNMSEVVAQHSSRNFEVSLQGKPKRWEMFTEKIPTINELLEKSKSPKELYSFTKDLSDYAWYSTSVNFDRQDLPMRPDILPVLQVASLGHALVAFVNGEYVGFGHGSNIEKSHVFTKPVTLKPGVNTISLLVMSVGFPNSGAYMEKRFAGPRAVTIQGLMAGTLDITHNHWGQQVAVNGEKLQLFTEEGSRKVKWLPAKPTPSPVTWYKTYFDAPEGNDPVALKMISMAKGQVWVNGNNIGRYWVSYLSALEQPTQEEYHVPRSFLKPKDNLLVVFEETGGNPEKIEVMTVNRDTICSVITEYHPPHIKTWERKDNQFRAVLDPVKAAQLTCPPFKVIEKVEFVSYGNAEGACGAFKPGTCDSSKAHKLVEQLCLGKNTCQIDFQRATLLDNGKDNCPDIAKTLAVQVKCGHAKKGIA